MEEYKVVRILNEEPEFMEGAIQNARVDYFILCEEGNCLFGSNVYDLQVAGMSLLNWVVRACAKQPKIIKVQTDFDVLDVIKPYIDHDSEYSVVLFANTPLVNKNHISDLLDFVQKKQMSVCKLKRGFIFRNDYISEADEFYSVDEYDFSSNDFLIVNDFDTFEETKQVLTKKVLDFNKRNGVYFENEQMVNIDAGCGIGKLSKIASNCSVINKSVLGDNCVINKNSIISGSKLGKNVKVGTNVTIVNSIVKDNSKIGDGAYISNSVVGANVQVEFNTNIITSSVRDNVLVKQNCQLDEARIGEGTVIGKHSKIIGLTDKTIVGEACDIGVCSEILDSIIAKEQTLDNCTKIKGKVIK